MFLEEIVENRREEVTALKEVVFEGTLKKKIFDLPRPRDFEEALLKPGLSIIAEIKKASPSAGNINIKTSFDIPTLTRIYEQSGAAAISILTEERYFQGSLDHLKEAKKFTSLPLLRKDFIFDPYQIYEARVFGADAVLLVAAILEKNLLEELIELTSQLGMTPLVEVHTLEELQKVTETEASVIGINNRDLHTFEVDLKTTFELYSHIPSDKIVISESGIKTRKEVEELEKLGINAILVGETLLKSENIAKKIAELLGENRNSAQG